MAERISLAQRGVWMEADMDTPVSLFVKRAAGKHAILLESAEVDGTWGRFSILADDFLMVLRCKAGILSVEIKDERLAALRKFDGEPFLEGLREVIASLDIVPGKGFEAMPPITRGLYGYLGYGISGLCVQKLEAAIPKEEADACLVLPGRVLVFDHLYNRLCELVVGTAGGAAPLPIQEEAFGIGEVESFPGREEYMRQVEHIQELLRDGEAIQVVLSTRSQADFKGNPFTIYRRLRRFNPSPYMFYMDLPTVQMMGASPELLIRCKQNILQLSPIAGTRKRGQTEEDDAALAADLLRDPKERAEHLMLVDLGRNDLGRIARAGAVKVERQMEVERFSHVMHLTSRISAQLKKGHDAVDIIRAVFPAGTVSGAPKVRAMEIIAETEKRPRGVYAGALGWIGLDKDSVSLDLGITIRSLWIKDGKLCWQSGAGIVFDSVPEKEYAECRNKAAVMEAVIRGEKYVPVHR